jgi:hypothetical protein
MVGFYANCLQWLPGVAEPFYLGYVWDA